MLKKKTMSRAEWRGIEERSFADMDFSEGGLSGRVGLMRMDRVDKPFFVRGSTGGQTCVTHTGFSWLQVAPKGENFWATAMFDERGNFIQCYFDITLENHLLPGNGSWFIDLLLDYVLYPDGTLTEFDRDELDSAFREGTIAREQYELARRAGDRLKALLAGRAERFVNLCAGYRERLLEQMKGEIHA